MRKRTLLIGILIAAVVGVSGCKSGGAAPAGADQSSVSESASEESASEDASEETEAADSSDEDNELYNYYVGVYNMITGGMNEALNGYFDHVPYQAEFTKVDESDYWCYRVTDSDMEMLESAYGLINAKTDKDDLDNAFMELYPVMKDLGQAINEVEDYTNMKSFLDDDYAKGSELHTRIYDDYQKYDPLSQKYLDVADPIFAEADAKELKEMKDQGYEMSYAVSVAINTAQEIQEALYESGVEDKDIIQLDTTAIQPLYDRYVTEVTACTDIYKDPAKMGEDAYLSGNTYLEQCLSSMKDSKVALTDILQRVANQEPVDEAELGFAFAPDGTIAKYDETVSAMIDSYNNMQDSY